MKKILLLVPLSLMSLMASANCTPAFNATVVPMTSVMNISGGGTGTFNFFVTTNSEMAGENGGGAPACSLNVTFRLKTVLSGTTVYTTTQNLVVGSHTITATDPCYNPSCNCYQYRWDEGYPYPFTFTIPNQSCGAYYLDMTLNYSSFSNTFLTNGSIQTNNAGGGTSTCTVHAGAPSCGLGNIQFINFSGTSGLAATTSSTQATCGSSNGSATINVTGGTPAYAYNWYVNSSTSATASSLAAGTYTVIATDANGCSLSRTINVTNTALGVTISPGSQTICKDKCLTLTATATPAGSYTYTWAQSTNGGSSYTTIGTGTSICVRPPSLSRTSPTTVIYRVTVTNGAGCTGTATVTIIVDPSCTVNFDNGCCSAGDGRLAGSGVDELVKLNVSPNPASDQTVISFNVPAENGYVEIYSATGQVVKRIDGLSGSGQINLDVNEFAAGTYSVVLFNGNVQMLSKKMVIVK